MYSVPLSSGGLPNLAHADRGERPLPPPWGGGGGGGVGTLNRFCKELVWSEAAGCVESLTRAPDVVSELGETRPFPDWGPPEASRCRPAVSPDGKLARLTHRAVSEVTSGWVFVGGEEKREKREKKNPCKQRSTKSHRSGPLESMSRPACW